MNRETILARAAQHITVDRAATHGNAEDTFATIAGHWNWWLGDRLSAPITPLDVAEMMAGFKQARRRGNPGHLDSYEDGCGYTALGGEIATGRDAAPPNPAESPVYWPVKYTEHDRSE